MMLSDFARAHQLIRGRAGTRHNSPDLYSEGFLPHPDIMHASNARKLNILEKLEGKKKDWLELSWKGRWEKLTYSSVEKRLRSRF